MTKPPDPDDEVDKWKAEADCLQEEVRRKRAEIAALKAKITGRRPRQSCTVDGVTYTTKTAAARALGISMHELYRRLRGKA